MKTFDYASAWREVAKPAYESLPQNLRDLLAQVASEADGLGQLPDCSMPWPNDPQLGDKRIEESDLRCQFDKIPAEVLALASQVIHNVGHWFPSGGDLEFPGRGSGAHWKFSHYADQSLKARLDIKGERFQIHEGIIRLCYSSEHMWTWAEVAPATAKGLETAQSLSLELSRKIATVPHTHVHKRDAEAWEFFEGLKGRDLGWPDYWTAHVNTGDRYMREEQEIRAAEIAKRPSVDREKLKNEIIARYEKTARKAERERDGLVWLVLNGLDIDNVIYYDHEGVFTFGWREPVTEKIVSQILNVISGFPFPYRIKCADGKTLEGGIG